MGDKTGIEWCDSTWNPVTGCTKVSPGCKHCYAETVFPRAYGRQMVPGGKRNAPDAMRPRRFSDVMTHTDRLDQPLRWKRARRIFVNSMSDLFHEDVQDEFIREIFAVMQQARQHQFQVLTKRAYRMRSFMAGLNNVERAFPNVWLGVSCEDQERADERIPLLLQTPAAVRFVSAEPLLGPIEFNGVARHLLGAASQSRGMNDGLDWIIVGGESGAKARPCDVAWVRSIRDQCKAAGVACFVKQLGSRPIEEGLRAGSFNGAVFRTLTDRKGGAMDEWPEDLRVREFPA